MAERVEVIAILRDQFSRVGRELAGAIEKADKALEEANREGRRFERTLEAAKHEATGLRRSSAGMGAAFAGAFATARRGVNRLLVGTGALVASLTKVRSLLAGFGAILVGKSIVKNFAEVERRVSEIGTLLRETSVENLEQLSRDIRRVAVEGGQTFEDQFTAAYNAISAGVPAQNLIEFLRTANQLAIGGVTDVNTATGLLVRSIRAFGLEMTDATDVADTLFTTVRLGITTIPELSASFGQVAPVARIFGLTLQETAAAMAALTQTTGNSNEAAVQLTNLLTQLNSVSDEQREAARKLGVDLSQAGLRTRGFAGFVQDLAKALEQNRDEFSKLFPNVRAFRGAAVLAQDDARALTDALAGMEDRAGAATEAFELRAQTFSFQMDRASTAVRSALAEVGNAYAPLLKKSVDFFNRFMSQVGMPLIEFFRDTFRAVFLRDFRGIFERAFTILRDPALSDLFGTAGAASGVSFMTALRGAITALAPSIVGVIKDRIILDILTTVEDAIDNILVVLGLFRQRAAVAQTFGELRTRIGLGFSLRESEAAVNEAFDSFRETARTAFRRLEPPIQRLLALLGIAPTEPAAGGAGAGGTSDRFMFRDILGRAGGGGGGEDPFAEFLSGLKTGAQEVTGEFLQLAELGKNVGATIATSFTDFIGNSIEGLINGTKSLKETFQDFARSTLTQLAKLIVQWSILRIVAAAVPGLGFLAVAPAAAPVGGQTGGRADRLKRLQAGGAAGTVPGPMYPRGDRIPALLEAREYVQPREAAEYYGDRIMDAIRRRAIPRGALQSLAGLTGRMSRVVASADAGRSRRMQQGGSVSPSTTTEQRFSPTAIVPNEQSMHLLARGGRGALLDFIRTHRRELGIG